MPIFTDPSNDRFGSKCPPLDGGISCSRLEELTGADYLVSPEDWEITKRYNVQEHLDAGAVMLQLKIGADLLSSVGDRLKGSMVKMLGYRCAPCQRGLVPVGYTLCDPDMRAYIGLQSERACSVFGVEAKKLLNNGYTPNYQAYNTALIEWGFRGGVVYPAIPHLELFAWYMKQVERLVLESHADPNRYHFETLTKVPDQPNPDRESLQVLKAVPDGVNILAAMPGIGQKRALEYYEFYSGDLMFAIINLASREGNWPKGWGETRAHTLALAWGLSEQTKEKAT